MTIYEFCELLIDDSQLICIYDIDKEEIVYRGEVSSIPEELEEVNVSSIDSIFEPTTVMTLNILGGNDNEDDF